MEQRIFCVFDPGRAPFATRTDKCIRLFHYPQQGDWSQKAFICFPSQRMNPMNGINTSTYLCILIHVLIYEYTYVCTRKPVLVSRSSTHVSNEYRVRMTFYMHFRAKLWGQQRPFLGWVQCLGHHQEVSYTTLEDFHSHFGYQVCGIQQRSQKFIKEF